MDWKTLFFSFDGRIGRRTWWLASIVLLSSGVVLTSLVNPRSWIGAPPNAADTLLSLALIIPETAVSVKRFNDRDWPQWIPYGFAVIVVVTTLLLHFRLILERNPPTIADAMIVAAVVAMIAFVVIDNGLLRGTIGANRHGPDPLPADAGPAAPAEEKKPHAA
jgi:uncharacterized membrane protein YhaH (DUF805 family)